MSFQNVGTYNAGVFTPKAAGPAPVGGVPVMDADGIASGGAFLVSELEKRDPLIRKPLTSFTYPRDIVIQTGGGWVDYVSAMSVAYGITGGAVNSPVTAGGANGIPVVQASVDKGVYKAHVFAAALRVMFQDMQRAKQYIAVLIDEYGGFSGIVTMEDLAEEVMGPIEDQGDDDEPRIIKIDNSTYILEGLVTIDDLNDELGTEIESENHDTVSGLLMDEIGTIPEENDRRTVQLGNLTFSILEIRERRIEKLKLQVDWTTPQENEDDEEE